MEGSEGCFQEETHVVGNVEISVPTEEVVSGIRRAEPRDFYFSYKLSSTEMVSFMCHLGLGPGFQLFSQTRP